MGVWQALAWRLERRFPDRWARRSRHELTGPGGGPILVEHVRVFLGAVVEVVGKHVPEEKFDDVVAEITQLASERLPDGGGELQEAPSAD